MNVAKKTLVIFTVISIISGQCYGAGSGRKRDRSALPKKGKTLKELKVDVYPDNEGELQEIGKHFAHDDDDDVVSGVELSEELRRHPDYAQIVLDAILSVEESQDPYDVSFEAGSIFWGSLYGKGVKKGALIKGRDEFRSYINHIMRWALIDAYEKVSARTLPIQFIPLDGECSCEHFTAEECRGHLRAIPPGGRKPKDPFLDAGISRKQRSQLRSLYRAMESLPEDALKKGAYLLRNNTWWNDDQRLAA